MFCNAFMLLVKMKDEMLRERYENLETFGSLSLSDIATDFRPVMKQLGSQYLGGFRDTTKNQIQCPIRTKSFSVGFFYLERPNSDEATEDEIEDW
jgi:hypothetical protein